MFKPRTRVLINSPLPCGDTGIVQYVIKRTKRYWVQTDKYNETDSEGCWNLGHDNLQLLPSIDVFKIWKELNK